MDGRLLGPNIREGRADQGRERAIGRPSSPRWELDIVAYSARDNLLRVVECKSYLDSPGVRATAFDGSNPNHAERYKLFNDPELRRVVFNRLGLQLAECGACRPDPKIRLCLACGRVYESGRTKLRAHFAAQDWDLFCATSNATGFWNAPSISKCRRKRNIGSRIMATS